MPNGLQRKKRPGCRLRGRLRRIRSDWILKRDGLLMK